MAKTGFWLQGAKGKVAGSTIYQANGETVMRVVNRSIKNPKTQAQMIQRIITKTVAKQYSAMKAIADHAFEGYSNGAKCMARFRSINNKRLRQFIADSQNAGATFANIFNFIPCKSPQYIPATVVLSEGTLPQIYAAVGTSGADGNVTLTDVENTYEGIINALNLQRGDQLTFVTVEKDANGNYVFKYARVILDPRESDGTAAPLATAFIENGAVVKPSFRNEGDFTTLTLADGKLSFKLTAGTVAGCAVIASRKVDNDWQRSTSVFVVDQAVLGEDNISLEEALAKSINGTPIYTDSDLILNNAGVGGPQAGQGSGMIITGFSSETSDTPTPFPADGIINGMQHDNGLKLYGRNMDGEWKYNGNITGQVNEEKTVVTFMTDLGASTAVTFNGETVVTIGTVV